ncbi:MAG: hypothetical protein ACREQT_09435 [Candidatus Binataceae bacterium]
MLPVAGTELAALPDVTCACTLAVPNPTKNAKTTLISANLGANRGARGSGGVATSTLDHLSFGADEAGGVALADDLAGKSLALIPTSWVPAELAV